MEGQGPTKSPAKLWPQNLLDLVGGSCLERGTRVEMWGFNITGPMPFVTEVFNYDQDNEDENIGPGIHVAAGDCCLLGSFSAEGIQRLHFGTGHTRTGVQ